MTNDNNMFGASIVAFPERLLEYQRQVGGKVFVLPSSIHEVILLKDDGYSDMDELRQMVRGINKGVVADEETLSDNVYRIGEDGRLMIA